MRQTEHKVTIPYLDYKEFLNIREKCDKMLSDIRSCFDTSLHDLDKQEPIYFRADGAVKVLKNYLQNKYKDSVIV